MRAWLVLALLVCAGAFLLLRGDPAFITGLDTGEIITLAVGLLLAGVYIASMVSEGQTRPMQAVRYAVTWLAIGFGLIAGYSYRQEITQVVNRVGGELVPSGQ